MAGARAAPPGPEAAAAGRWVPGVGAEQRGVGRLEGKRPTKQLAGSQAGAEAGERREVGERGGEGLEGGALRGGEPSGRA